MLEFSVLFVFGMLGWGLAVYACFLLIKDIKKARNSARKN